MGRNLHAFSKGCAEASKLFLDGLDEMSGRSTRPLLMDLTYDVVDVLVRALAQDHCPGCRRGAQATHKSSPCRLT